METKQISSVFLHEFKIGRKTTETARNVNSVNDKGTTSKRTAKR